MGGKRELPRGADISIDAVAVASRALGAIAAHSLAPIANDLTLLQYCLLVELAERGPQPMEKLASTLGRRSSNFDRMCERLVRKGLICRRRGIHGTKEARVVLRPLGREVVDHVNYLRRTELVPVLRRVPRGGRRLALVSFHKFAEAAEVVPDTNRAR